MTFRRLRINKKYVINIGEKTECVGGRQLDAEKKIEKHSKAMMREEKNKSTANSMNFSSIINE
jgi:hypothetical protein